MMSRPGNLATVSRIADFADKAALAERLRAFIAEWDQHAHPFNWSTQSVAKIMAKCQGTEAPQGNSNPWRHDFVPFSLRRWT